MSKIVLSLALLLCIASGPAKAGEAPEDVARIRHLLLATFDKPDAPLTAEPIVVVADHAIADWTQNDMGGRALLHKQNGAWTIFLCGGDALKTADFLARSGVSPADAEQLAARLSEAERQIPAERIARLSRFDGVVTMDNAQQNGAHHP